MARTDRGMARYAGKEKITVKLDPDMSERLSQAAEAGQVTAARWLRELLVRKASRPGKPPTPYTSPSINAGRYKAIYPPIGTREALDRIAADAGMETTDYIRSIVHAELKRLGVARSIQVTVALQPDIHQRLNRLARQRKLSPESLAASIIEGAV